jgi:hypothetical protein
MAAPLSCLGNLMIGPSPLLPFLEGSGLWEGIAAFVISFMGNAFPLLLGAPWGLKFALSYGMVSRTHLSPDRRWCVS